MVSRNDVILLLTELEERGLDVRSQLKQVITSSNIPMEVVKFINDNRQLDLTAFYTRLRKNYNEKKSKLYLSIVREVENPTDVITTLHAYGLQVALYAMQLADNQMFLRHARAKEVAMVLSKYYSDYDLTNCLALLRLLKADIVACETITGHRKEQT